MGLPMAGEVVAVPNRRRGTWVAAIVVPSRWEDREEYVRVVSSGHLSRMAAQVAAVEFALFGDLICDHRRQPPR